MPPKIRRLAHLGHFHDLLLRACPPVIRDKKTKKLVPHPDGTKSIALLAEMLGMSSWGVHLWIKKGKLPPLRAQDLVDLNPEEVTLADFSPYIYR